jgi:spermidine/putrescine transport system substrate-binding protein
MKFAYLVIGITMLASVSRHGFAETISILNWEAYLSEEIIEKWEAQTGHKIRQIYYDNEEHRDTLIANYEGDQIDLVVLDRLSTYLLAENKNTLLDLNDSRLASALDSIDPKFQKTCSNYGIPYLWGSLGLAYRTDKITKKTESWSFILDPADDIKGHIGLIDDYTDALIPALLLLGYPINTDDNQQLQSAFKLMKNNSANILTYDYSISFLDAPNADDLYVALAYSGDQYALNEKQNTEVWEYTTVKEGTVVWTDCLSVMNNSPRKDIALSFIEYLYQPEIAAKNSEALWVATPVVKAKELQSNDFLEDQSVYIPQEIMDKSQSYAELSAPNLLLRNRINSALLKLHESP